MVEAAHKLGETYDAIIVDEAQDFLPDWWTYLELLFAKPEDSIMYAFADANQNLYRDEWLPPFDSDPFPLDLNCRNTKEIAQRVTDTIGITQDTLGVSGPEAVFKEANTDRQVEKAIKASLDKLLDERDEDELRRLAYVGMSRARSVLYVIGSKECRELIGWK